MRGARVLRTILEECARMSSSPTIWANLARGSWPRLSLKRRCASTRARAEDVAGRFRLQAEERRARSRWSAISWKFRRLAAIR